MTAGGYNPDDPLDDSMFGEDDQDLAEEETGIDYHVSPSDELGDDTPTPRQPTTRDSDEDEPTRVGVARIREMPNKMARRFPTAATVLITRKNGAQILFVRAEG